MTRLLLAAAVVMAIAPAQAQRTTIESPVHATLRLVGERTSFKMGEPVRLELVLTADKPGFVADTMGAEDPSDVMTINPENGVHRLEGICCRDYFTSSKLSAEPTVVGLAANYWARFDRAGAYAVSIQTRRVSPAGSDGTFSNGKPLQLTTNPVTFRIEPTSLEDEQELIASAVRNLQSAVAMGPSGGALGAQIRAAESLSFLSGDVAAMEKYRRYVELGTVQGIPGNARNLLRRGFQMSRNPGVILAAVEADLEDLNQAVSADTINNAASLAVTIKYPGVRQEMAVPAPPGGSDPFSVERDRYLEVVHESLDRRSGLAKLLSAGAMLDILVGKTPADVVRILVDGFEQLPVRSRSWFASGRWEVIRDVKLGPVLRRTLDEVEPGSRSYIFPALIDVAPSLALEPLSSDILDPKRLISAEIVRKMPRASLSHLAPQLAATIQKMATLGPGDRFRVDKKIELLGLVGDATVRKEVLLIYDSLPKSVAYGTRESLLRYLLEWDPDEGTRLVKEAALSADAGSLLYKIASDGPSLPALNAVLKERLFDRDPGTAAEAAGLMARDGRVENRDAIELRLLQWRLDRQQRVANGESLNGADGSFESRMVQALVQAHRLKGPGPDRDRLLAACLTEACKTAFRER